MRQVLGGGVGLSLAFLFSKFLVLFCLPVCLLTSVLGAAESGTAAVRVSQDPWRGAADMMASNPWFGSIGDEDDEDDERDEGEQAIAVPQLHRCGLLKRAAATTMTPAPSAKLAMPAASWVAVGTARIPVSM